MQNQATITRQSDVRDVVTGCFNRPNATERLEFVRGDTEGTRAMYGVASLTHMPGPGGKRSYAIPADAEVVKVRRKVDSVQVHFRRQARHWLAPNTGTLVLYLARGCSYPHVPGVGYQPIAQGDGQLVNPPGAE